MSNNLNVLSLNFETQGLDSLQSQLNNANKAMGSFSESTKKAIEESKGLGKEVLNLGKNFGSNLTDGVKKAGSGITAFGSVTKKAIEGAMSALGLFGLAMEGINKAIEIGTKAFETMGKVDNSQLAEDFEKAQKAVQGLGEFVTKVTVALGSPVFSTFSNIMDKIHKAFSDTTMIDKFANAIGRVQAGVSILWTGLTDLYDSIMDAIMPAVKGVSDYFGNLNERFGIVTKAVGYVVGSFNYLIETIKDCSDVLGKLFTGDFLGAIDSAKKAVVNLGKNYISVFTDMEKNGKAFFDEWEKRTLVFTNQAKVVLTSSLKDAEIVGIDTANTIKNSFDNVNDGAEEAEKALERLKQEVRDLVNNSIQLGKGISDMIFAFTTSGLNDLSIYDKEITKIQEKIDAFNKAKQEQAEKEKEDSLQEYDRKIANLDEELALAKEIGDEMTVAAIENKKKEIQKTKEEEKKKLEQEKKNTEEEKALQNELAMAQYNKDYAAWQNQVKEAETQKNKAIADTVLQTAQAIANAAMMPLLPGWAAMGPVGIAAAAVASATSLATALSSIGSINSAATNLEQVKNSPPSPPKFAYGTGGYALKANEYAIVGEQGPEMVRQRAGGDLEVISTERTKNMGISGGIHIENLIFQVSQVLTENEIFEAMNNYKARNSFMFTR